MSETRSKFDYHIKFQVTDQAKEFDAIGQSTITYTGYDKRGTVEDIRRAYFNITLDVTEEEEIINLTDLIHQNGNALEYITGTNQQLLYWRFAAGPENTGPITITPNPSQGYNYAGEDSKIILKASQWAAGGLSNSAPDIDDEACKILVTGNAGDFIEVTLIMTNNVT